VWGSLGSWRDCTDTEEGDVEPDDEDDEEEEDNEDAGEGC
jgi:hypothetical protein